MSHESTAPRKELVIDNIFFIRYSEHMNDYMPEGECYDFWKLLCVDKGTANVSVGSDIHTLNKDSIIFHQPGELHHVRAKGEISPSLISIGWECHSAAMDFFRCKILEIGPSERTLLGNIVKEARLAYSCRFNDQSCQKLIRRQDAPVPFGSEQLVHIYLQQFLIQLIRNGSTDSTFAAIPKSARKRGEDELFYKIISYMEEHIYEHLSIPQICKDNLIGRSLLQQLFRDNTGYGIIDYFSLMKINAAKRLIREGQMNFSQIADYLGYNSIHYFSRQFKKLVQMTPSEYAASVRPAAQPQESSPVLPSPAHNRFQNTGRNSPHRDT